MNSDKGHTQFHQATAHKEAKHSTHSVRTTPSLVATVLTHTFSWAGRGGGGWWGGCDSELGFAQAHKPTSPQRLFSASAITPLIGLPHPLFSTEGQNGLTGKRHLI